MAKKILNDKQIRFLELFKKQKDLTDIFYLSGGSALAYYYLKHRYSEDLDLFTQEENFDWEIVFSFMRKVKKQLKAEELVFNRMFDRRIFYLKFSSHNELKVEFTYYPFKNLEKTKLIEGIKVDSLIDITTNKFFSIFERHEVKDYIDLYFLLKKYSLKRLQKTIEEKFAFKIDPITVGTQLLQCKNFDVMPKMIKKVKITEVKEFFTQKAQELKNEILQ